MKARTVGPRRCLKRLVSALHRTAQLKLAARRRRPITYLRDAIPPFSGKSTILKRYMNCRACESSLITEIGTVEYYSGFAWPVFDCQGCGCRFTNHAESIYEVLHAEPKSIPYYNGYRDLADKCRDLFQERDLDGLRAELFQTSKYKFIIEQVERSRQNAKLLEIGC